MAAGRQRGSSTAEYLGVLSAVALLMLALMAVREHRRSDARRWTPWPTSPSCSARRGSPADGRACTGPGRRARAGPALRAAPHGAGARLGHRMVEPPSV